MNFVLDREAIGLLAGALTTTAFLPQARQIWRTRSTRDISLSMYAIFTLGVALWLVYGWLVGSISVIAANAITLVIALFILGMKLRES